MHGGIYGANAGSGNPDISYCYNIGNITTNSNSSLYKVGGIAGDYSGTSDKTNTISYCYNAGKLNFDKASKIDSFGGIAGMANNANIINCYNTGDIIATAASNTAGIAGYLNNSNSVTNCYNTARIKLNLDSSSISNIGGIVGDGGSVNNCYNIGQIDVNVSNNTYIGSIIGYGSGATNCYYISGTYANATGKMANGVDTSTVVSVENETAMKTIINTNLATIDGWKVDVNGYPKFSL